MYPHVQFPKDIQFALWDDVYELGKSAAIAIHVTIVSMYCVSTFCPHLCSISHVQIVSAEISGTSQNEADVLQHNSNLASTIPQYLDVLPESSRSISQIRRWYFGKTLINDPKSEGRPKARLETKLDATSFRSYMSHSLSLIFRVDFVIAISTFTFY